MMRWLFFSVLMILLTGCFEKTWYTDAHGVKFYTSKTIENPKSCEWLGDTIGGVANGWGKLLRYTDITRSTLAKTEDYYAILGNIDAKEDDDPYADVELGHQNPVKLQGFAVVSKGDELYIGEFVDNRPNGLLKFYKNRKIQYDGNWIEGRRHGHGTMYIGSQKIEGEWENDRVVGDAFVSFANGYYEGELLDYTPHGKGSYYSDEMSYSGDWVRGRREGKGTVVLENEDTYTGSWKADMFDGQGVYEFHDGGVYSGEWKNGLQYGFGTYRKGAFVYEGNWRDGVMDGQGTVVFANGDVYSGEFKWNAFNGKGAYSFADGTMYKGDFVLGRFNGMGTLYLPNNRVLEGEFSNNKLGRYANLYYVQGEDTVAVEITDDSQDAPITLADVEALKKQYVITGNSDGETSQLVVVDENGKPALISRETANSYMKVVAATESVAQWVSIGAFAVMIPFPATAPVLVPFNVVLNGAMLAMTASEMAVVHASGQDLNWWEYIPRLIFHIVDILFCNIGNTFKIFSYGEPSDSRFSEYTYAMAGAPSAVIGSGAKAVVNAVERVTEKKVEKETKKKLVEKAVEKKFVEKSAVAAEKTAEGVGVSKVARPHAGQGLVTPNMPPANKVSYGRFRKASDAGFQKSRQVHTVRVVKGDAAINAQKALAPETRSSLAKELSEKKSHVLFKTIQNPSPLPVGNLETYAREVAEIRKKGPITLSHREMEWYRQNPNRFAELVREKTGKHVKEGFMEFLIRTKMGNVDVVRTFMTNGKTKSDVRNWILKSGGGGTHEWFKRSHVDKFLLDPKYGKNGDLLFYMQNKFVQRTENVIGKTGFVHKGAHLNGLDDAEKSWHNQQNTSFHDGLDNVINRYQGDNPVELAKHIDKYAQERLTQDSYNDFKRVYDQIFSGR